MFRGVFALGLSVFALSILIVDLVGSPATSTALSSTTLADYWRKLHPSSVGQFNLWIAASDLPSIVRLLTLFVLAFPAWFFVGTLALSAQLIGRGRRGSSAPVSEGPRSALYLLGLLTIGAAYYSMITDIASATRSSMSPTFLTMGDLWSLHDQAGRSGPSSNSDWDTQPAGWPDYLFAAARIPVAVVAVLAGFAMCRIRWLSAARRNANQPGKDQQLGPAGETEASSRPELAAALSAHRRAFLGVGIFSGVCNLLMLTGAFFMLQIYDRVLPSRSIPTLVALGVLVAGLFLIQALLDAVRSRILVRIGDHLDQTLSRRVFDVIVRLPLKSSSRNHGLQPVNDLDSIRSFLASQGPSALFDLPWMPIYLAIIFSFHPVLGLTALVGALILVSLTLLTEFLTRRSMLAASQAIQQRNRIAESGLRNSEVLAAMGMTGNIVGQWSDASQRQLASNRRVSDVAGGIGSLSRGLRLFLQSAVLGVGAYLVIGGEATAGIIIAGAILVSRALAPVDLAIAHWRSFVAARQGWKRLEGLLSLLPKQSMLFQLPPPQSRIVVEGLAVTPPSEQRIVLQNVSFALNRGDGLGIIGPSGAGKSSLARVLVGVWGPVRGRVMIDGASLSQWTPEAFGAHVGYLPQDVELFAGSIAQNISRFEVDAAPDAVIAAAKAAGVHSMIVDFPNGYETEIGELGKGVSAGQRQRIALARALYRDPFLVVLDEPNSNLDVAGETALTNAMLAVRSRGGIIVVVAHRPSALAGVDKVLALSNGQAMAFGPKDEVLTKVLRQSPANEQSNTRTLKVATDGT